MAAPAPEDLNDSFELSRQTTDSVFGGAGARMIGQYLATAPIRDPDEIREWQAMRRPRKRPS